MKQVAVLAALLASASAFAPRCVFSERFSVDSVWGSLRKKTCLKSQQDKDRVVAFPCIAEEGGNGKDIKVSCVVLRTVLRIYC